MSSQSLMGKQLRSIGRSVLELLRSGRFDQIRGGGPARTYATAAILFCVIPVVATVTLYLAIPDETTEIVERHLVMKPVRVPDLRHQMAVIEANSELRTHEMYVSDAETLKSLFAKLAIQDLEAQAYIRRTPQTVELLYPKIGQYATASVRNDGRLEKLRLFFDGDSSSSARVIEVMRSTENGDLSCKITPYTYEVEHVLVNGVVHGSSDTSLQNSQVPAKIIAQMHGAFDYDRDIVSHLKEGDTYSIIYEAKYAEGSFVRFGKLLAMKLDHAGKSTELFWFRNDGQGGNYYDLKGNISRRTFMRVPLDVKSVSSEFSPLRRHPVTGVLRPHHGTDFRAPWGATVRAAADGVVEFAGVGNGYGNYIRIKHGPDILTLYAHLSHIAPYIKKGATVKYGDIIGRVGQTGLATGPHLHYELKFDGIQINPMTAQIPDSQTLTPYQFARMEVFALPLRAQLERASQASIIKEKSSRPELVNN